MGPYTRAEIRDGVVDMDDGWLYVAGLISGVVLTLAILRARREPN